MILLLLVYAIGGTSGSPPIEIDRNQNQAGLYYEPLQDVYLVQGEWKVVTFFDIHLFESYRPSLLSTPVDRLERECQKALGNRCSALINSAEIRIKNEEIARYLMFLRLLNIESLVNTKRIPHGTFNDGRDKIFEPLPDELAKFYKRQFRAMSERGITTMMLKENRTHIVKSTLPLIQDQLRVFETNFRTTWELASPLFQNTTTPVEEEQLVKIIEWKNSLIIVVETYLKNLRILVDSIHMSKQGLAHPDFLGFFKLKDIRKEIAEQTQYITTPISDAYFPKIIKSIRIFPTFHDGKLIISMHLPIAETRRYALYRLHAYPTEPIANLKPTAYAYVQPSSSHLLLSNHDNKYAMISEENLRDCNSYEDYQMCPLEYPLYDRFTAPNCEILIINETNPAVWDICDIRIEITRHGFWKPLTYSGEWLFSLSHPETLNVNCGEDTQVILLSGQGILSMRPDCHAHNGQVTINGTRGNKRKVGRKLQPEITLKISILTQDNLSPLRPEPELISEINQQIIGRHLSLAKLKIKISEIKNSKSHKDQQDQYINSFMLNIHLLYVAAIGNTLIILGILIYLIIKTKKTLTPRDDTNNSRSTEVKNVEIPEIIFRFEEPCPATKLPLTGSQTLPRGSKSTSPIPCAATNNEDSAVYDPNTPSFDNDSLYMPMHGLLSNASTALLCPRSELRYEDSSVYVSVETLNLIKAAELQYDVPRRIGPPVPIRNAAKE